MKCSICGKDVPKNIVIKLGNTIDIPMLKHMPINSYICEDCVNDMQNRIILMKEKVKNNEELLTNFLDNIYALCVLYVKVIADSDIESINIQTAITYSNHLIDTINSSSEFDSVRSLKYTSGDEHFTTIQLFKQFVRGSIIEIYNNNDFKSLSNKSFCYDFDNAFAEYLTSFKHSMEFRNGLFDVDTDEDDENETSKDILNVDIKTPIEIKKQLDKYVVGQETAKKILSVGIYNHYMRIVNKKDNIQKSNILFIGPTGCGKTELARTTAKILDVPFCIVDSTSFTSAGFVGNDVEDILKKLILNADGDISKAEKGIVYIDEIDKIAKSSDGGKDVNGEEVQQALLKIIEGSDVEITLGNKRNPMSETVTINTSNILFIFGGAFEGLTMTESKVKLAPGFNSTTIVENDNSTIDSKALIKFGMIPELIGRIPIIAILEELTEDDLVQVLIEPKDNIISQYTDLIGLSGKEIKFTNKALHWIAHKAYENKTGARGLKTIIENNLLDTMFELPDEQDITKVQIGVKNNNINITKYKKGEK